MTSRTSKLNGGMLLSRNELSMPKWVTEQSDRIGPRPPPPPTMPENGQKPAKPVNLPPKTKQPEPDYEVIEFSNQQYSNAPLRPNSASSGSKTPDNKLKCTLCGSGNPWVTCEECAQQIFCASCDDMFHKHPKRKGHQRKTIEKSLPPLPPKVSPGQAGPTPPMAPPRRNKRGLMTPIMQRKDQGNAMPGLYPEPTSPTPSTKTASWQDHMGSMPRGLSILNRPLPETPKTTSESSRSTTPRSVFDSVQRPPSVALEKIKSKANATLDRMQLLQQRYRQQKEQMERERSGSATDQRQMALQHHRMATQRANQLGQRGMSSSVFNLNQMNRKQPIANNNGWIDNSMQQAQSMAQLNCNNCAQHQLQWNGHNPHHIHKTQDPWSNQLSSQQHLNRSNMSLNVPTGYMMQPQMNNMYPPPTFMNQRNLMPQMYPQSYMGGMPIMNPGLICMPPSTSRAPSRAGSRLASPAMSRKSVTLRRKQRSSYIDDEATDDEDSDEDDRRSITSIRSGISRSRHRRMSSASQFQPDEDIESTQNKLHRNRGRGHRRDSVAKSVHSDWAPGRKTSSTNINSRSADSGFNSPLKPPRIYSDLDSEGSGTRALVQAKIEQKLKEESLKQKQSKTKRRSKSPPLQKTSAAVQTPALKQTKKQETIHNSVNESLKKVQKSSESELEMHDNGNNYNGAIEIIEKKTYPVAAAAAAGEEEYGDETESDCESGRRSGLSEKSYTKKSSEETEQIEDNKVEEDDLGPPPSTPDHEWECEFCTFVNEANVKICSICCKTPIVKPKPKTIKPPSPPKHTKSCSNKKDEKHIIKTEIRPVKNKNGATKKCATEPEKNANQLQNPSTDAPQNDDDHNESTTDSMKNKESVEDIWASLDENIHATTHEVTRKAQSKKSSKAGHSSSSIEQQLENDSKQSQAREIGTSPPPTLPQSISTQTYDTLPNHKTQTRDESGPRPPPQSSFSDVIQKHDIKSLEAEVLNKIHNISHVPSHYNNHHANHPMPSYNDHQRCRSNNDLRIDDTMPIDFEAFNGLGKRQPSINELMLFQKTSSQMHSPFGDSTYDLPYREFPSIRPSDMENHKESDIYKHTTEELNAAIKYCGPDMHPLVWLRDNWPKLIQTVQSLATKYGQERAENTIGTISQMEARDALRKHTGNIWQAVSECIEQRQRKYREISSKGNFPREDIVTALTTHQGNVDLALIDLERTQLKPFLMRIWGSPGGVENESGSQSLVPATPSSSQYNMDRDIHSFLSINASECLQTSHATGAYPINNQTPSPFDLPASLNSSFDNNNHTLDKTSSYISSDSKNIVNSSPHLDESILSNKNVLKDLETLIGNMEHHQERKQDEHFLRSVHDMITNMSVKTENEYDPEILRILTKSPIISPKSKTKEAYSENNADVKNFVWQNIQEIMPNLVPQVEFELVEDNKTKPKNDEQVREISSKTAEHQESAPNHPPPPIDQEEFLMEEVIKPNIKNANIREELPTQYVYTAEIATFQMAFDKGLEREHEEDFQLQTLEEASRQIYKMFKAPESESIPENKKSLKQINKTITPSEYQFDSLNTASGTTDEKSAFSANQSGITPPIDDNENAINNNFLTLESANVELDKAQTDASHSNPGRKQILPLQVYQQEMVNASVDRHDETQDSIREHLQSEINNQREQTLYENPNPRKEHHLDASESKTSSEMYTDTIKTNISNQTQEPSTSSGKSSVKEDSSFSSDENKSFSKSNLTTSTEAAKSVKMQHETAGSSVPKCESKRENPIQIKNINKGNQTNLHQISNELEFAEVHNNINETSNSNIFDLDFSKDHTDVSDSITPADAQFLEDGPKLVSEETLSPANGTKLSDSSSTQNLISTVLSIQPSNHETIPLTETKILTNEASTSSVNKRVSKIPVRRTESNKSLVNSKVTILNKSQELSLDAKQSSSKIHQPNDESEDEEVYSIASNKSTSKVVSIVDQSQFPSTSSEMFLLIQQERSETASTIAPSTSNSTLHSISSNFKSSTDFIPSGDPSKQNLTELVKDTQRLIKQMKDEISIDDFESSTDEGDYSDEFSDDYDDEEEGEEGWGEEEEEDDDDEYDDITEGFTEKNDVFSTEEDSINKTHSPLPSQESQDHRTIHNSSALSNITESSDHSLVFLNDNFEQDTQYKKNLVDDTNTVLDTTNNLSEVSVEPVIDKSSDKLQTSAEYVESQNNLAELSVEILLPHAIKLDDYTTQIDSNDVSTSQTNVFQSENYIPELPVEVVIPDILTENADSNLDAIHHGSEELDNFEEPNNPQKELVNFNDERRLNEAETALIDSNKATRFHESFEQTSDHLPATSLDDKIISMIPNTSTFMEESISLQQPEIDNISTNQQTDSALILTDSTTQEDIQSITSTDNKNSADSLQNSTDRQSTNHHKASSTNKSVKTSPTKEKLNATTKSQIKKPLASSKIPKPKEISKEQTQKEVPASKPKNNNLKKNLYTRSKSFSGPPTPIGIASVKTISQKFSKQSTNAVQPLAAKKHPTVTKRSSITETVNKFTKPSSASTQKPVTNSLFKSRTQPRIPKKKYHETCFSDDDFEASSEEVEIEAIEVRQRKLSVPVFKAYASIQEPEEVNTEELVERFIKEELATNMAQAQIAATLVSMKFQQEVSLWAAKECSDLDHAIELLKQECELCSGTYPLNEIVSMLKCTHKCCKQCAKTYFTVQINERSINDCSCPFCKLPQLHNQTEHEDENLEYFSNLDIFLKNILEPEVHELFQRKLRDRTLLKDPNFKWCVQCSSGFFARPKQKRLICPDCGSITCAQCRKTWQKQHERISCDQFSKWELANDPDVQAKGVQQHLEQNGIECPKCKFKYSLARGGCMHFTCTQCKYEFCYGCAKPFMMGAKCNISPYCAKLGLHAHHPRNCLFYLRDKLPVQLQILLKNNNVSFEVDPIEVFDIDADKDNEPSSSKRKELLCAIQIQKETPTGLVDTKCNGDVPEKHAGMCRNHYVEYLTAKVAKAKIDPLPIFDLTDCVQELRRRGIALPERGPWDTDEIYKNMCAEVIQKNIPLDMY